MTELLTDINSSRADLRMIETAIRKRWQIPEQLLEALPKTAAVIALKGKPRDQIAAMSLLVKMKEQNDRQDKPEVVQQATRTTINVGVNVDNRADERRSRTLAIAERVRASGVLRESES